MNDKLATEIDRVADAATREALRTIQAALPKGAAAEAALSHVVHVVGEGGASLRRNHVALMRLARSDALARGALDEALREIMETAAAVLGVERASAWLYDADQTAIRCIELFIKSQRSHESGVELPSASYPAYFRALTEERTIPAHDAHTDPRTREFSEGYLKPLGIGAMLDTPIRVGGRMIGVLCNEHVGPARHWTAEEEQFAGSIADFLALAIESSRRREAEEQLRSAVEALEGAAG